MNKIFTFCGLAFCLIALQAGALDKPRKLTPQEQSVAKSLILAETDHQREINFDQSFVIHLENDPAKEFFFLVATSDSDMKVYLATGGKIISQADDINSWHLDNVEAVAFADLNHDGFQDFVIIASYETGIGSNGATPFNAPLVILNDGGKTPALKPFTLDTHCDPVQTIKAVKECFAKMPTATASKVLKPVAQSAFETLQFNGTEIYPKLLQLPSSVTNLPTRAWVALSGKGHDFDDPTATENVVLVRESFSSMTALEALNGKVLWKLTTENGIFPALVVNDLLYAITYKLGPQKQSVPANLGLLAIDSPSGKIQGGIPKPASLTGDGEQLLQNPLYSGSALIVLHDGQITAWDPNSSQVKWDYTFGKLLDNAVADDKTLLLNANVSFEITALDAKTGQLRWKTKTPGGQKSDLFIPVGAKNEFYLFAKQDEKDVLVKLDLSSGAKIWSTPTATLETLGQPPVALTEKSVVVSTHAGVTAFDRTGGAQSWSFPCPPGAKACSFSTPITSTKQVFIVDTKSGTAYAIDASSGKELWHLSGGFDRAPALLPTGIVLHGSAGWAFYKF